MGRLVETIMQPMTIGILAKEASVNVETVRYYERRGLIERPKERQGVFRVYPPEAVSRIRSIKQAESLGFSLKEIKELLMLRLDEKARCSDVLAQTEKKLSVIDEKLRSLQALERELGKLTSACRLAATSSSCPILVAFGDRG